MYQKKRGKEIIKNASVKLNITLIVRIPEKMRDALLPRKTCMFKKN